MGASAPHFLEVIMSGAWTRKEGKNPSGGLNEKDLAHAFVDGLVGLEVVAQGLL